MTKQPKVLLTGATGNIGGRLAPRLAGHDSVNLRVFVRNPEKFADLKASGVEVVEGSFEDEASLKAALDGIDTVVLITPFSPDAVNQAHAVIEAAQKAQVRRIVRLSVIKADPNGPSDSYRQHGVTDDEIIASNLTYTILRPNMFMSNLSVNPEDNTITTTLGNSQIGMIDPRDIVDVFERIILSDEYDNQIFALTGPTSISLSEATEIFSKVLNKKITYIEVSEDETEQWWRNQGASGWYLSTLCEYSVVFRKNYQDVATDSVERITGHPARSLEDFIKDVYTPSLQS